MLDIMMDIDLHSDIGKIVTALKVKNSTAIRETISPGKLKRLNLAEPLQEIMKSMTSLMLLS